MLRIVESKSLDSPMKSILTVSFIEFVAMIFKNSPKTGINKVYAIAQTRKAIKAFRNDKLKAVEFLAFYIPVELAVKIKNKPKIYQKCGFLAKIQAELNLQQLNERHKESS